MEQQIDFIGQTSEFARVYGIEFCDVIIKGTQYKVESMMLRIAKPLNFVAVSPNVQQRVKMNPPECIQLTLEPESQFYADPVIVLDFQSLYPSIMIAYNYCFSTCLGNIAELEKSGGEDFKFGCTSLRIPAHVLSKLKNHINVSPNGVAFVKEYVRKGVISRMVEEILDTRLMVKRCMSRYKSDKGLHKLLHARQLGLKLIANVTFGYTAANFSGRMPCVEVGDSIVRKARETLENAIKMVNENDKWNCRVIYGDTDSLFVLVPGRDLKAAFKVGEEIRDAVTAVNPKPIKLKLEKVCLPLT
ncbi:REV3L [Bugula neritina]|uniref:DNA polymerase zeta catalytic subunit n=1 Tax=Bugula neritina TaxID=10212 RepID=A0A7J7KNW9_BUGNE|nr:REV3L [Bugula neritina]